VFEQKWKGLFYGPLVLKTLAAHFTAIKGACKVPEFGDPTSLDNWPRCALAMAAATVRIILHNLMFIDLHKG